MEISNNLVIIVIAILLFGFGLIYEGIDTSETLTIIGGVGSILLGIIAAFIKPEKPQE
jgi:uncharacterized YccA/Bax inhibitor family protein